MKKYVWIIVILALVTAIFLLQKEPVEKVSFSAKEITVGMHCDEFYNHPDWDKMFFYMYHLFFTDKNGKNVVVEIDPGTWCVTAVFTFPFRRATASNMKKVKEGMTILQLVELVGIPSGTESSGAKTLAYYTKTGEHYWVYIAYDIEGVYPEQTKDNLHVTRILEIE